MKFDLHFHTTLSDGQKTPEEVVSIAKQRWIEFIACTDHDLINTNVPLLAEKVWIQAIEWVELSSCDYENNAKSAHLTCYSLKFRERVHGILDGVQKARQVKIDIQIDKLKKHGFYIDKEWFYQYWIKNGANLSNLNNGHIREYLFLDRRNEEVVKNVTGLPYNRTTFINDVLSRSGKFSHIGSADNLPPYEPSLDACGKIAQESSAILSIAHPNHTFKTLDEFSTVLPRYVERGVNALEIHVSTPPEWIQLILETRDRYNLLLTFWSDCHFDKNSDKHGMIGDLNPYVEKDFVQEEFKKFQKAL